jgi:hypothetical protein
MPPPVWPRNVGLSLVPVGHGEATNWTVKSVFSGRNQEEEDSGVQIWITGFTIENAFLIVKGIAKPIEGLVRRGTNLP